MTHPHRLPLPRAGTPPLLSLLTEMKPARKAFRSLRSFTHAARHHPAASQIVSDPIVDDHDPAYRHDSPDHIVLDSPTPVKPPAPTRPSRVSSSLETEPNLDNHVHSPGDTPMLPFKLAPQQPANKSPSPLAELTHPEPRRAPLDAPFNMSQRKSNAPTGNKRHPVFDLEHAAELPQSPPIKRRRTRSSACRSAQSSPSPEVDQLLLRQLVDNASDEERKAILAASASSRGRRKLHQIFIHNEQHDAAQMNPNASKDADVEWLRTSYDSVEEVAPTPSPQASRKTPPHRLIRASHLNRTQRRTRQTTVERIDSSESPERVMRRRSRRLNRDISRGSTRGNLEAQVETIDSSSSPGPERRRSRRIARQSELPPPQETEDSDGSDHSESSGGSVIEKAVRSMKAKRRKRISRSRALPRPKAGLLRERLRRRTPLLPIKRNPSKHLRKKITPEDENSTDRDDAGLRRSKRLRDSHTRRHPIVDVDADDEVIEEGSADENEDDGTGYEEEEVSVEDIDGEEDEDDGEMQLDDGPGDEEDDDEEDDDDFEEREWKEQLKRKQIRRKQKRNGRRKRTQPRNVFSAKGENLTAREQKERLDFLVKQSQEIARELHKAMREGARKSSTSTGGVMTQSTESAKRSGEVTTKEEETGGDKANHTNLDTGGDDPEGDGDATRKEESFYPPSGSGCELQPHQKEGVDWLLTLDAQGLNAILADEMGLGKTIQAVSFLTSLVVSGSRGPHLVVAPKNVCQHWADEVRKWYPNDLTVAIHLGSLEDRLEGLKPVLEDDRFDIIVTSFEIAVSDLFTRKRREGLSHEHAQVLRAFRKVEFEYLVVDEAHRLKNDASKTNIAIRNYSLAQRRLLLTGTPLSNDLKELWCLMNVLNPSIFSSKATFETWFAAPFASKTKKRLKVSLTHAEQSVIVDRLHTVLRPFFRRRIRRDVCPTFTSADEVVIRCPLSGLQRAVQLHLRRRATADEAGINNVIIRLRAASNHPYTVSGALIDRDQSRASERLVANSGKFVFLHFALPRLINSGHRVLIFSQFKDVLDLIEQLLLDMLVVKYRRLDGETSSDDRTNGLTDFNREGSDIPVFLLTTRAGGIGLNLQTADTVILFDSDWNPSADLQAVSRIQRIGQTRTVHILRLVTEKSVDDLIVETARHKLRTQNVAVGAGKFNTSMGAASDARMRQKDLEDLLKRLEVQNHAEDQEEVAQIAALENSSPESSFPKRVGRTAQNRRFEEWGKQLLRKGESTLSSVDIAPIWVDNQTDLSESRIPHWLAQDADLQSAAKALNCRDASSACRAYEENLLSKAEAGNLSKKDRATRARRQITVIDMSDADSESETERGDDPSVDSDVLSHQESDDEVPDDENATEKEVPKKTSITGLLKGWTVREIHHVAEGPTGSIPVPSGSMGSSQACRTSKPLHHLQNDGPARAQTTLIHDSNGGNGVVHVNGGADKSSVAKSLRGFSSTPVNRSSAQRQPGSTPRPSVLPTAHLKRLPPANLIASGSQFASQTGRKQNGAIEIRSGVPGRASSEGTRNESRAVPRADHHFVFRNGNLFASNASPGTGPPTWRGPWDPTTMTYSRMQQTVVAPAPLHSHTGLSGKASRLAIPTFSQHVVATTVPAGYRCSPLAPAPASGGLPSSNLRQNQEKDVVQDRSGNDPAANVAGRTPTKVSSRAKTRTGKQVTDPAYSQKSISKKPAPRRSIVMESGELEFASSSDLCGDFWFVGTATEEMASVRPTALKTNQTQHSNVKAVADDLSGSAKAGSHGNAATVSVPSAKTIGAEQFAAQVERLREMTKVVDTEFLEDALLDCDCDIEAACKMVRRQMN